MRSVRCGYCGERGHNRRSCPQMMEALRERYKIAMNEAQDKRSSQDARAHAERRARSYAASLGKMTGENPMTGEKVSRRRERGPRRCSYCHAPGHTRRTCETLKADKRVYQMATRAARLAAMKRLQDSGVGVGTVFTASTGWYDAGMEWKYGTRPFFVTQVHLDDYTYSSHSLHITGVQLAYLGRDNTKSERTSLDNLERILRESSDEGTSNYLVSPAGSGSFSEEWLAADNIDWSNVAAFAKGRSRDYIFREVAADHSRPYAPEILRAAYEHVHGS